MSVDKSMLDRLMAMPRKELVDDAVFYHDGWISAGRECNELKAENAKLREWCSELLHMAESNDPDFLHWPEIHEELRKLGVDIVKL